MRQERPASPSYAAAFREEAELVAVRNWSPAALRRELAHRGAAWGWWVALALAAAFFLGCVLLCVVRPSL